MERSEILVQCSALFYDFYTVPHAAIRGTSLFRVFVLPKPIF